MKLYLIRHNKCRGLKININKQCIPLQGVFFLHRSETVPLNYLFFWKTQNIWILDANKATKFQNLNALTFLQSSHCRASASSKILRNSSLFWALGGICAPVFIHVSQYTFNSARGCTVCLWRLRLLWWDVLKGQKEHWYIVHSCIANTCCFNSAEFLDKKILKY